MRARWATITQLKVQKRDKDRVSVFLDGEYAFSVSLLTAARWREQELSAARDRGPAARRRCAPRLSAGGALSGLSAAKCGRDGTYLSGKGYDRQIVADVCPLEAQGYLDDHAFARFWVENREQFRPRGRRALAYELRQKGVPRT